MFLRALRVSWLERILNRSVNRISVKADLVKIGTPGQGAIGVLMGDKNHYNFYFQILFLP